MTERDQEAGDTLPPVGEPGEAEPEEGGRLEQEAEALEERAEALKEEAEALEDQADALKDQAEALEEAPRRRKVEPKAPGRRWFGLLGRRTPSPTEGIAEAADSIRGTHAERVHIDDRASALFALVCAGSLVGVLLGSFVATHLPKGPTPTLPPLVVDSASPAASGSALPSGSTVTSPSAIPSATPAPTETASPEANPS